MTSTNLRWTGAPLRIKLTQLQSWPLVLLVVLLFVQFWAEVGGTTVRSEDLLMAGLLGAWLLHGVLRSRLRYRSSPLNVALLVWLSVLLVGILVSLQRPIDSAAQRDALINGIRLILAFALFFAILNYPTSTEWKTRVFLRATVQFSFVTTAVALLQVAYWADILPFALPPALITIQEGANDALGREIFALFLGNTGTHVWSAMLSMQALTVWAIAQSMNGGIRRRLAYIYFLLLAAIVVRTSVRSSIVGLALAVAAISFLYSARSRYPLNRILRPLFVGAAVALAIAVLFTVAPDSYFIERIREAVPQFRDGELYISRASNIYGRLDYYYTALLIFRAYPLLGGGFRAYEALSGTLGTVQVVHAHNSYLQVLADLGLIGMLALLWLIIAIGFYLWRVRPVMQRERYADTLWYLTVGSFVFLAFTALITNPLWEPKQVAFRMVLLGLTASYVKEAQ